MTKGDPLGSRARIWAAAISKATPPDSWDVKLEDKVWSCGGLALPPCGKSPPEKEASEKKSRAVRWRDIW